MFLAISRFILAGYCIPGGARMRNGIRRAPQTAAGCRSLTVSAGMDAVRYIIAKAALSGVLYLLTAQLLPKVGVNFRAAPLPAPARTPYA